MSEIKSQEQGGPATSAGASVFMSPELEFDDGDDVAGAVDAVGVAEDVEDAEEADTDRTETADSGELSDNPGKYGYMPCYRTFRERWFWTVTPWDIAHLFMDLLLRANRAARKAKVGGQIIEIGRGVLATSISKMSADTGRDRKTVRKWLSLLTKDGELEVVNKGQNGIVITMLRYDTYALDDKNRGQRDGQHDGQTYPQQGGRRGGQNKGRSRGRQRANARNTL